MIYGLFDALSVITQLSRRKTKQLSFYSVDRSVTTLSLKIRIELCGRIG